MYRINSSKILTYVDHSKFGLYMSELYISVVPIFNYLAEAMAPHLASM